jgi:hypothetical protein
MAGRRVKGEEHDVGEENERAHADAEAPVEGEGADGVVPEEREEDDRQVEKVPVNVLQDEGERRLPAIAAPRRFPDGARGRIEEERAVISLAVVVARRAEPEGAHEDQKRRRKRPPAMFGIDQRRVERREIGPPLVVAAFERADRRVDGERSENEHDRRDLDPPGIAPERRSEAGIPGRGSAFRHEPPRRIDD